MIKIKKISLQNFKGIKKRTSFNFDNEGINVNILSGPNGFGKTTIFDVIEICLTGEFKRVEIFDHVQKKNNNKNKPFFQNTDNEDVILKLWIEDNSNGTNHVIIKHYDDDQSPTRVNFGRDFIPADANKIFKTYLTNETTYFESNDFSALQTIEQKKINELFYGENSNVNLSSTYYLFNYIQQEDSIYFLRKNEDDKGSSLGFLFNIEKEENEKQKINQIRAGLIKQQEGLKSQIDSLRQSLPNFQGDQYQRLFAEKDIEFDRENPFTSINGAREKLNSFEAIINALILFRNNFNVSEYEKSIKYKKLNDEIIGDNSILSAIVLRKVYTPEIVSQIEIINTKIIKGNDFLKKPDLAFIEKDYFDLFLTTQEELVTYLSLSERIKSIDKDLGEIGRIISEINNQREKIVSEFVKIKGGNEIPESNCPLCDSSFDSFEALRVAITSKTETLTAFNTAKLEEKVKLQEQIKSIYEVIAISVRKYLSENKLTDSQVIALLRNYPNMQNKIDEIFQTYSVLNGDEIDSLSLSKQPNIIAEINEKQVLLKAYLEQKLLPEFRFDTMQIENKQLYAEYFNSNSVTFTLITAESLNGKLEYLRSAYSRFANERLQFLEGRNQKLSRLILKISNVYEIIHRTIQDHKAEMIQKIKIPFYIYSGKILQSYQQGLGIFVEIHSTDQSNNVRFKTGHYSDHDIVYHLSSGQMAVVSLAFCLSLNKVYNTNENFKFLSIDDPIQTMDDLNIHTFIELVRNEFSSYQLIMSTHDDFTSRYMKYKFDKFGMTTDIQNIQEIVMNQSQIN